LMESMNRSIQRHKWDNRTVEFQMREEEKNSVSAR
jgi:hypothetical protein